MPLFRDAWRKCECVAHCSDSFLYARLAISVRVVSAWRTGATTSCATLITPTDLSIIVRWNETLQSMAGKADYDRCYHFSFFKRRTFRGHYGESVCSPETYQTRSLFHGRFAKCTKEVLPLWKNLSRFGEINFQSCFTWFDRFSQWETNYFRLKNRKI